MTATYKIIQRAYWYARIDGERHIEFTQADLLENETPEQYAKKVIEASIWPEVDFGDFDKNQVHELEQYLGDLQIDDRYELWEEHKQL